MTLLASVFLALIVFVMTSIASTCDGIDTKGFL